MIPRSIGVPPVSFSVRLLAAIALKARAILLEMIAERKVRRRQLTDDGNIEITGRDLREREARASARSATNRASAILSW